MKCISWNVNGIRAVLNKDFVEILYALDADFVCIQETKAQPEQIDVECEYYPYQYKYSAIKKGYSGTMIFAKEEPLSVQYGLGIEEHDIVWNGIRCLVNIFNHLINQSLSVEILMWPMKKLI